MSLEKFLIDQHAPLRLALELINANKYGVILAKDHSGRVIGLATDGDIRDKLLKGLTLDDPIGSCINSSFIWAPPETPREVLLKKLDSHIKFIPLLDGVGRLVDVVTRSNLPELTEGAVYARSRAPVRISFGGGGSDLTHYFSSQESGAVINTTISIYSHATLRIRDDDQIIIRSLDLGQTIMGYNLVDILSRSGEFGLIQAVLKVINPNYGFELFLHSDFPMKSGLGGSAVVSATILGCFNQFRRDQWDSHELAELAYQAERHYLGVSGGWQDQYATVFGGFNFMEFRMDQNVVHPLRISADTLLELEESLILCDTGTTHDSGEIHDDQRQNMAATHVKNIVEENVKLSYRMRNDLLRGRLLDFGHSLDKAWRFKRHLSDKVTTDRLDYIYSCAIENGAVGGKLLGAGGGGFFLFYVPPFLKHELIYFLQSEGLMVRPFRFEQNGLQSWTVREIKN